MSDANEELEAEGTDPKALRDAYKAQKKLNDEMATELKKLRDTQRASTVADILKEAGANPGLSRFYQAEEASPEAVKAWLAENGEFFGITPQEELTEDQRQAVADSQRASQVLSQAPAANTMSLDDLEAKFRNTPAKDLIASGLLKVPAGY